MATTRDTSPDIGRLIDLARRHAAQLREQAIDDFWNEAGSGARRALRSAARLAASLSRHARLRVG